MAPSKEQAAQYGLTVEEASGPPVELWPDNVLAVDVFATIFMQWRVGVNGAFALDYGVIEPTLRMMRVPAEQWPDIFEAIQVMEPVGLAAIRQGK